MTRFERLNTEDEHIVLYHQVLNHVQLKRRDLPGSGGGPYPTQPLCRALQHGCQPGAPEALSLLQGTFSDRVSLSRRQTIYRFERLPSPLKSPTGTFTSMPV